jgi:hypothetical protein
VGDLVNSGSLSEQHEEAEQSTLTRCAITCIHLIIRSRYKACSKTTVEVLNPYVAILFEARCHNVGLDSLKVDVGNLSLITIKNLGNFFEGGATSLNVEDRHEDELEENPALATISM